MCICVHLLKYAGMTVCMYTYGQTDGPTDRQTDNCCGMLRIEYGRCNLHPVYIPCELKQLHNCHAFSNACISPELYTLNAESYCVSDNSLSPNEPCFVKGSGSLTCRVASKELQLLATTIKVLKTY